VPLPLPEPPELALLPEHDPDEPDEPALPPPDEPDVPALPELHELPFEPELLLGCEAPDAELLPPDCELPDWPELPDREPDVPDVPPLPQPDVPDVPPLPELADEPLPPELPPCWLCKVVVTPAASSRVKRVGERRMGSPSWLMPLFALERPRRDAAPWRSERAWQSSVQASPRVSIAIVVR
jgi:hypothetical protein